MQRLLTQAEAAELLCLSERTLERLRVEQEPISALEYLRSIYRNPMEPTGARIRAAVEALPYKNPRLSAVAVGHLTGDDFASRLERAVEASEKAKLIEGRVINQD